MDATHHQPQGTAVVQGFLGDDAIDRGVRSIAKAEPPYVDWITEELREWSSSHDAYVVVRLGVPSALDRVRGRRPYGGSAGRS